MMMRQFIWVTQGKKSSSNSLWRCSWRISVPVLQFFTHNLWNSEKVGWKIYICLYTYICVHIRVYISRTQIQRATWFTCVILFQDLFDKGVWIFLLPAFLKALVCYPFMGKHCSHCCHFSFECRKENKSNRQRAIERARSRERDWESAIKRARRVSAIESERQIDNREQTTLPGCPVPKFKVLCMWQNFSFVATIALCTSFANFWDRNL